MLDQSLKEVLRTTSRHQRHLSNMGICTVNDLLCYFPRDYEDERHFTSVSQVKINEKNVLKGWVSSIQKKYSRNGKLLLSTIFSDTSGAIEVIWFNQPFIAEYLKAGDEVILSGRVVLNFGKISISNPTYEKVAKLQLHTARIVPIYPESLPITSKWLREKIYYLRDFLNQFQEYLPERTRKSQQLINLDEAMKEVHFPTDAGRLKIARHRLGFDELFMIQLLALKKRWQWMKDYQKKSCVIKVDNAAFEIFLNNLTFTLTNAQNRAIKEIYLDLERPYPMLRLLQGDVGSGKTVVAAAALLATIKSGYQGALMAPTEILAKQHLNSLSAILKKLNVNIELLIGSLSNKGKNIVIDGLKDGRINIVIGTHALIQDYIEFKNLGLAVIDEQHRFGVKQRDRLKDFGNPNLLNMTATPIPRTLALTLYGDQELSILDEMPKGRKLILTRIVPEHKRSDAYSWIREQVKNGQQVFVICPLIDESDVLEVKSAIQEYQRLANIIFPDLKIGLIHGKLTSEEKDLVMKNFASGEIEILVSTSVIEVGIDIPNASIIMIEGAERFGLAQLHQFRGRVGRGFTQSYCLLFPSNSAPESLNRLKALERHNSGFVLAEIDLKLRGPGEFFGLKQSGVPDLKMANLSDIQLIKKARQSAIEIIKEDPELNNYPEIRNKVVEFQKRYDVGLKVKSQK